MTEQEVKDYNAFLEQKKQTRIESGFQVEESELNPMLFDFQKYCVRRALQAGKFALFEDCGLGKEQPYSEPVLTPNGYALMGDLKVGDFVVARNGKPTRILNIYEQGEKNVYRVTFSDGTSTRCGLEHLWNVKTLNDVSRKRGYRTLPLKEIMKNYVTERIDNRYPDKKRKVYNYSVPVCDAVVFANNGGVTINPYILGVIIGDGCISQHSVSISKPNRKLRQMVQSLVQNGDIVTDFASDGMTFRISNKVSNQPSWTKCELEKLGLMGKLSKEKFIPNPYLYASVQDRKDLLQGLVDTDGHIVSDGVIEYSTASAQLCNDVSFLARSLGYIVRVVARKSYYKKGSEMFDNYRIYLYNDKAKKLKSITNIELVGKEKCRCIYVDDTEHLYITNDFVVTHNTVQQLEWANKVVNHINKPVLILAPLAVVSQTIKEGEKFGYNVNEVIDRDDVFTPNENCIYITNYDNMEHVDAKAFGGIVLDESSILKNFQGKTRTKLIEDFRNTPYKLACTATPSPNDTTEICNHAEFLDVMSRNEMLAMYFVHDGGSTSKWRLKGHATQAFWDFVSTWAVMLNKPSDIGYNDSGYSLPPLNVVQEIVETPKRDNGMLFNSMAVNATDFHKELRETYEIRLNRVVEIVNAHPQENFIIWIGQDNEGKYLRDRLPDAVEVKGSDSKAYKKEKLLGFGRGEFRLLITKLKIAQFGLNYQNCHNQIYASLDFSFEATYQGIRRSYRFGQTEKVNIYLITTDTMQNVKDSFDKKQKAFVSMQASMTEATNRNIKNILSLKKMETTKQYTSDVCDIRLGDCVQLIQSIPDESIGFSIFSPPFAELYTYSDKLEDMGNSKDYQEFFKAFKFLVKELYRVMWSGRNVAVHCMDLPIQKCKEGYIGLRDFSGMILQAFTEVGFIYHSRVTIWKNPVTEMQRTKALGLLHKQVGKDAAMSRVGIPDYLMVFRKEGEHKHPVHCNISVDTWQKYASPVWMDIDYSNTLNARAGRDENDEKHICLAQGTLILTKRGYVPIENVEIGDETITHMGRWRKIVAKAKTKENAQVVKVNAVGVPNLICTPNHKLWAREGIFVGRDKHFSTSPNWVESKDTKGMYINQKLPDIVDSPITEDEWWVIGRWVADGHIDARGHQFFVSIGDSKFVEFNNHASKFIGHISHNDKCNCTQIGLVNLSDDARNILYKCGKGAENKVIPFEIISLNQQLAKSFLDGYLSGDGCNIDGKIYFSSASRSLLLGISLIVHRVYNKQMAIYAGRGERVKEIQGRLVNCKQEWVGVLSPNYGFSKFDEHGCWKPVKSIDEHENVDVWNIEVEEDHSYTAEGCVVKNCPLQLETIERSIILWSNEGDTVLTPFMGIGSEVYEAVKLKRFGIGFELKDSYFAEAVKNIKSMEMQVKQKGLFD